MTTTISRQDCLALPYVATSEGKAGQFAAAIEVLFGPGVEVDVFEDGGRWGVAVVKGVTKIDNPLENDCIVAAFILLMHFDLVEKEGDTMNCVAELLDDVPPAHAALTRRARRQFRIEDKLDAILNILHGTEDKAALTKPEGDAHRLPDGPRMSAVAK